MSTQPQQEQALAKPVQQTSPLVTELAARWKLTAKTMIDTLKATVFPQKDRDGKPVIVTDGQLVAFLQVCHEYDLNPQIREIYAFPTKGGGIVPMVPVDGWSKIINRNPQMNGVQFRDEWEVVNGKKVLISTTCIIHRKDRQYPTEVTEYLHECMQANKDPWIRWPARMLRHKAFIQCARIAFSLAGIYDPDEAERIAESGNHAVAEVTRPQRVVEGTVVTEAKPASTSDAPQNGGASTVVETEKVTVEENRSTDAPASSEVSPTADEVGFKKDPSAKPVGPYASKQRVQKLCAVARAAGINVTDNHEDALHKMLADKYGIQSLNEIPETLYDEVLKAAGGDALKIK